MATGRAAGAGRAHWPGRPVGPRLRCRRPRNSQRLPDIMNHRSAAGRAVLLLLALASTAAGAEKLTLERLFAAPDLSGASLRSPQISPDGRLVAYLRAQVERQRPARPVGLRHRGRPATGCSSTRRASRRRSRRRPRRRRSGASGSASPRFRASSNTSSRRTRATCSCPSAATSTSTTCALRRRRPCAGSPIPPTYETDARFSPRGRYVSFVRDQNLVIYDLERGTETAVTRDGARAHQLRHGGVHRAGGDGPHHRVLVVAGRAAASPSRASTNRRSPKSSASRSLPTRSRS